MGVCSPGTSTYDMSIQFPRQPDKIHESQNRCQGPRKTQRTGIHGIACDRHCVHRPPGGGKRFSARREPGTVQRWAYTTRREGPRSRAGRAGRSSTGRHPGNRPYAPGLAAALIALVVGAVATGCTAGASDEGATGDAKAGSGARTVAQPGKYRTLLEPCGAVADATLRELLPGIAELPEDQQRAKLRGEAAGTFDSDRRVGCAWRAASATGAAHTFTLDFERVVSYDAWTSDTDRVCAGVRPEAELRCSPPGTPACSSSP
ncbi:secreted serine-rich protein, partial [Streptomyces clavuligerus]